MNSFFFTLLFKAIMKNLYCFLSLVLFFNLFISDATFASIPEGINLTKTSNGYDINFTLPSFELLQVSAEGNEYDKLVIPGYGVMPEAGLPALPLISFNLYIADQETQPGFEIKNFSLDERDLKNKIYPFQMPWEKSNPIEERPFTINSEYYNTIGNMDQPFVDVSEPFIIGGVKGVTITLYPFRYNPLEDKLVFVKNGRVNILLNHQVLPVPDKSRLVQQYFRGVFANYEGTSFRASSKYLIITAPTFVTGMQQFITHKVSKGFEVDMFSTDITGTTTTSIKNFIQQRYDNPSTKPEFVLLVGDVAQIPAWTGQGAGTPKTDVNYVQLDGGDYYADAFIGRFSVSNSSELQNAINKSVFMEDNIGTLTKKNIYMASTDNWQISEGTHNYIIDQYFDPSNYTNLKLYTHTYGATTQQLINALNDDQIFAIYSGHGSEYSWADGPPLSQSQVENLTNIWYPFVFSFACVTGSYHLTECFGETWLRTENGASTFYGSSVNSYWDEDDILEKKIFEAMFEDNLTRVTPMFDMGKIYLVNYYGGGIGPGTITLRYVEMYNLMGDPSMPLVEMGPPCPIDPAFNPNPIHNATDIPISDNTITWENGIGANQIEIWLGEIGNLSQVYGGSPITSFSLAPYEPLEYNMTYGWQVKGINDTCSVPGTVWKFTTMQDPNIVIDTVNVYPQSVAYWTGTTDGATKTDDSEVRAYGGGEDGWMMFDISSIPDVSTITQVTFYGYVNLTNYPWWSATPLPALDPLTATASELKTTIQANTADGTAYVYSNESSSFTPGAYSYLMETWTNTDLQAALAQDWFAMGIGSRDGSATYYIEWDGWAETNVPYLEVLFMYVVPVELTSFAADIADDNVQLNWRTATEINNQGFEIQRRTGDGEFEKVGFVPGHGTTTDIQTYSYVDSKVASGKYTYRLKQIDFNGTFEYSDAVAVEVTAPLEFTLEQNYPNPFNPSTVIKYSIPENGFVSLVVYNLLGEKVASLVNGVQDAGRYEISFDASNFASGIYVYSLKSGSFSSVKKMLLMK